MKRVFWIYKTKTKEPLGIKSNYASALYADSLLFTQDVLYTQSPYTMEFG